MKCAACGYEYIEQGRWVDKVTRFKSGKNKGAVKDIKKEWLDTTIGGSPFIELEFGKGVEYFKCTVGWNTHTVSLYACPECHTVRFE